jgi:hypothetical protein
MSVVIMIHQFHEFLVFTVLFIVRVVDSGLSMRLDYIVIRLLRRLAVSMIIPVMIIAATAAGCSVPMLSRWFW